MVNTCYIYKIESGQVKGVSFHQIPQNEEQKQQWFLAIGREVGKYSKVCSLHFAPTDFRKTSGHCKQYLIPSAVPSKALPSVTQSLHLMPTISECLDDAAIVSEDLNNKSLKNQEENLHLMPTRSRFLDDAAMSLTESANVLSCVQNISCESTVAVKQIQKRKRKDMCSKNAHDPGTRYIGDIGPDDFMSTASWIIVHKYVKNTKLKIKMMQQTIRRLQKKVNSVTDMLEYLKKNKLLSAEATNALTISNV